MLRPVHLLRIVLAASLAITVVGCSDEASEPAAEPFSLTVTVLDPDGQPRADAPVIVLPFLPPGVLQDGKQAARAMPAMVTIPFVVARDCLVDVEVLDVAGGQVRQLLADFAALPGTYSLAWDGRDDAGDDTLTGWYEAVLVCRDEVTGEVLYTDSRNMLRIDVDSDLTPFVTGADGTVTITDRRLVPGFWDLPPVRQIDENGDLVGVFTLTEATELRAGGGRTTFDAIDGPQAVTVQGVAASQRPAGAVTSAGAGDKVRQGDPFEFELRDPRPNPFN